MMGIPPETLLTALTHGAIATIQLTLACMPVTTVTAVLAGLGRASSRRLVRVVSTLFVEIFRGTSQLVQLFVFFFALPLYGITLEPFATAVIVLGLNAGAYGAEIVRGSMASVPRAQREAAIALGMSHVLILRRVLLPQALPPSIPPFTNLYIELLKGTALVSLIFINDLTFQGQLLRISFGNTPLVLTAVLVVYFVMAQAIVRLMRGLESRVTYYRRVGGVYLPTPKVASVA